MSANWWEAAPVTGEAKPSPAPARPQPAATGSWYEEAPAKAATPAPTPEPILPDAFANVLSDPGPRGRRISAPSPLTVPTASKPSPSVDKPFDPYGGYFSDRREPRGPESLGVAAGELLVDPLVRGWRQTAQASNVLTAGTGLETPESAAHDIATRQADLAAMPVAGYRRDLMQRLEALAPVGEPTIAELPPPPTGTAALANPYGAYYGQPENAPLRTIQPGPSVPEVIWEYAKDPRNIVDVALESGSASLASILMGAGGGAGAGVLTSNPIGVAAGAALGAGGGSFLVEFGNDVLDTFRKNGVNLADEAAVLAAFRNPQLMSQAREHAAKRGAAVALFDALSAGVAGRTAGVIERAVGGGKAAPLIGELGEVGVQAGLGGAGEAAGSVAVGEKVDPVAVAQEILGEMGPGAAEILYGRLQHQGAQRAQAEKSQTTPPPDPFDLTMPTTQDFASILSPTTGGRTEPYIPSDIQPDLPLPITQPELPLPGGGAAPKVEPQPELPLGTIAAPASTGSRSPELDSARASAPVAPDIQGTASPLSSEPQTSKAAEPAASPAPPAPQEPAPTPAPQAQPVSTAQEPPAGEAATPAKSEQPPAQTIKTGKSETVTTATGTKVDTEYEVAEADDLVTSDKSGYPKQLQPRERGSRVTSQEQVAKIGGSIDPDLLGPSPHAEHGAPIIGSDDNNVESGNGRVMALRQMYARDPERAQKYREMVARVSGQDVDQMRNPVLVRRRKTPMTDAQRVQFAKEANKTSVSRMSAGEQAKVDQDAMTPEVMAKLPDDMDEGFDLSKPAGQKFVAAFVSKFPVAERGELVDADGKPSTTATTRAKAALLQKGYGGSPAGDAAIRRAVESTSTDAQTLINTLVRFSGPFAKLREDIAAGRIQDQADIGGKIAEAIEVVRSVEGPGGVTNWLKTEDMLNPKDPVVQQLIETFYSFDGRGNAKRLRTGGAIGTTLNEYLKLAQGYTAEQAGGGLFGEEAATPKLNPAAELGRLNAARHAQEQSRDRQEAAAAKAQQGLFTARGEPSGSVSSGPSDANSGEETPAAGPRESGDESDAEARAAREEAELEERQQEYGRQREADVREFRRLKKTDPEFKRIASDVHPESGAAGDTFQGWKDAKAGTPIDPQRAQQMLPTADMRPHGFNPVQGYLVGYAAALGMKPPIDIRAFDALDWLHKIAAHMEPQFSQDEEMTDLDEDVGTTAATEEEPTDEDLPLDEEVPYDDTGSLSENLSGKTGPVPRGPNIPGKNTATDPLQTIGQRKADQIAAQIERERQAEVAPKRESELRESQYDSMWRDLHGGMHPGETPEEYAPRQEAFVQRMRNAPIRTQLEYAQRRLKTYFDFKGIRIDPALNSREALDAMLDAYNNLHTQASIMGQPKEAMGFNGDLTLSLDKSINRSPDTRGMFSWKFDQGFGASVLSLARRADSFTHEWLHALDLNLLMRFTKRKALGASGASNLTLTPLPELPKAVHDAFVRVMRAILLTDEASMTKLGNLVLDGQQTQEALTKARQKLRKAQGVFDNREEREAKAVEYDKDADRTKDPFIAAGRRRAAAQLRAGNQKAEAALTTHKAAVAKLEAKLKQIAADMKSTLTNKASALAQGSRFVDFMQGRPYFSLPAELFARAGESWMGNRVGQQAGVEFLAGSPNYYNHNTDEIMALVYPNEADRTRIFSAFDDLFAALAADQYFAGETVASKIPQPNRLEKELWLAAQRNAEVHAVRAALQATKGDIDALWRLFSKLAHPVDAAKAAYAGVKDQSVAIAEGAKQILYQFYTGRGRLNGMVAKAKAAGQLRLAARLRTFARLLTDDPGSGELQRESLEQEYMRQSTADLNEFHDIVTKHSLDPDDDAQMAQLHEELAKPTAQVLAELEDYKEFLQGKLDATKGDRNKVRTAEALKFQIAALEKKMEGFAKPSTAPGSILNAADEIRTLMNTAYYRQQEAGIDVGYVSNYMSRSLDDEAINANRAGFVDQAQAVYEFELHRKARALNRKLGQLENELQKAKSVARNLERGQEGVDAIRQQMAAVRNEIADLSTVDTLIEAQNWLYSSQVADMFQADRSTPPSNYTKARKLGPIADILMSEFYDQNPLSSVQRYLPMAAKRAAYARRFGNDHSKYEQMRHEFLAAGMEPEDLKTVDELLKIMSGTYNSNTNEKLRAVTDALYNTATNALLPFSLFAQIAEPLTAGIRTGRLRDGLINIAYTGQQLIRRGKSAELRQIAEIMGLISSAGTDTIVQSRMFQEDIKGKTATVSNFFYRVTGVHGYTAASRIGTMKLSGRYLSSWADTYLASKAGSKERADAEEEFRELGIPPKMHERFAKYVQSQGDMMSINTLLRAEDAELKQHYVVATHRFVDTVIGNPKASDRARMASSPVGRFIMSISSFNYFFQRHVLTRFGKRLQRSDQKMRTVMQFVLPFMALMVGTMMSRMLREWLQDKDKLEKRVEELATVKGFFNAIDAAGGTGGFTPLYNLIFKSKFRKDFSTLAMGAAMGFYIDAAQDIYDGFADTQDPKDHTSTAERKRSRAFYRLMMNSSAPRILEAIGLRGPLGWAALTYATSYNTAQDFANLTVGKTPNEKAREAAEARKRPPSPASEARKKYREDKKQKDIEKRYGQ